MLFLIIIFPIFNIADIAVVIGVILIIFEIIFEERNTWKKLIYLVENNDNYRLDKIIALNMEGISKNTNSRNDWSRFSFSKWKRRKG